mgnify:CR=1 FL=1
MRYINVEDQYVSNILNANKNFTKSDNLRESTEFVVEEHDHLESAHACPLCESELDEPVSEEAMQECVDFISQVLEEAALLSEEISEAEEADYADDADEDDEDDEGDEDEDEDE